VSEICIRTAQLSDRDQLLRFREALWPNSSAEEHSRELTLILEGKAVTTLPLIILVAELGSKACDRILAGFLEVDLRSHADGCDPSRPVDISRVGTLLRSIDTTESGGNSWPLQKTGHAVRGALK
jgi:aminoglycoside 6'-N-acetyltransferase I